MNELLGALLPQIQEAIGMIANEYTRPAVVFRPRVFLDGSSYCVLLGDDLMSGVAGFGESPHAATTAFDVAWHQKACTLPAERHVKET